MTLAPGQRWTVIHGDCLEVLPTLADKSVAHVVTDPPYEAEAHTLQRRVLSRAELAPGFDKGVRAAALDFDPLTAEIRDATGRETARVSSRWILVFCQAEAVSAWRLSLTTGGARYMRPCIWTKPNGQPQLTGDRPAMGYESIVVAHSEAKSRWNGGGRRGVFNHAVEANFSREPRVHDTQKPLNLMLELVELFTDPDDLVLDPFCGSGTTGVACLRLGRRFIGIEKDEKYAAIARERLEAESRGLTLRDVRHGQTSIFDALKETA
jgi:site-specific DNA-methyltransferase (adenine-specific)